MSAAILRDAFFKVRNSIFFLFSSLRALLRK